MISANPKISRSHGLRPSARRPSASRQPGCAPRQRCSHALFGITEIEGGFPHSEIPGSKPVRGSPGLIAAYHVLHRLSAPRHPPNALMALDRSHRQRAPFVPTSPPLRAFRLGEPQAPLGEQSRPDSTRQSTGPTPEDRGRTGVGLFEKTSFASNASGNLSGQARLTTGLERLEGK